MAGVCSKSCETNIEEFKICSLGNHQLQNPKLLPCNHSYCFDCIKNYVRKNNSTFTCPKCNLLLPLKEIEIQGLCDDFLFSTLKYHIESEKVVNCLTCSFENKTIIGTHKCIDCADVTCKECSSYHTFSSVTRNHTMVPIEDIKSGKYKMSATTCKKHSKPDKPVTYEFFCNECKCFACHVCATVDHLPKGHTCKSIDEMYDEKMAISKEEKDDLYKKHDYESKWITILEKDIEEIPTERKALENEVLKRSAHLLDLMTKREQDNLQEIQFHFKDKENALQAQLQEIKDQTNRTRTVVRYADTFLKHSSKAEYLQYQDDLHRQMMKDTYKEERKSLTKLNIELGEFNADVVKKVLPEAFGKVCVENTTKDLVYHEQMLENPRVIFDIDANMGPFGVTVTEDNEYIAVARSIIHIYNSEGKPMKQIKCQVLNNPWDVVAKGSSLYISNHPKQVIEMNMEGDVKRAITVPDDDGVKGVAVDDDGTVYVCTDSSNTIYTCKTNENEAKSFISKQPDLKGPIYLDITPGGDLVVSNYISHTIQVYNKQKQLLWQYGGQGIMQFAEPYGVCCDNKGYVYVADSSYRRRDRIQVLYEGELKKSFTPTDGFSAPRSITVDKENYLICSHSDGKLMKIKIWE